MKKQLVSEWKKLFSTRTVYLLTLGVAAIAIMAVLSVSGQSAVEAAKPLREQQFFFIANFVKLLIVVLGIRVITDEYRFGTIVPTFVYEPRRWKVVAAKSIVALGAGLMMAAVAQLVLIGSALAVFSTKGLDLAIDAHSIQAIGGSVVAGAMWAAVGVAVGAVVRNQVTAIVGSFVWLMAVEEMIGSRLGDLAAYLPGGAGYGLILAAPNGGMLTSALVLGAYVVVGGAAGAFMVRARDVT